MADELPQALLVRALAKEGLELIEQITWETYILEHSQEAARLREQLPVLTKLVKTVEAEKPFFQQTIEKMNSIIQLIMDAPKELSDIMAPLKSSLKSNPE
ncbi:MAG: hypothetical protein HY313_06035 [Acidobacteria bacterium]|nr:hypothetical protein [Acidobacteriota bacterium]